MDTVAETLQWHDEHGTPIWARKIDGQLMWNPHIQAWGQQWTDQMRKVTAFWMRQIREGFEERARERQEGET